MNWKHVSMAAVAGGAFLLAHSGAGADGYGPRPRAKTAPPPAAAPYYREREPFPGWSRVDPYAYQYEPRGYYPYYNSGYWRPNCGPHCAPYYQHPPYWEAWGYTPAEFIRPYEGRIRRHHW